MAGSYTKINYRLRPAKSIERKMLCSVFYKLSDFARLDSYQYVGLGSNYFSDFILFHKSLGINKMFSIEANDFHRERFDFNVPYNCIEVKYGTTTDVLPNIPWDQRSIVWLDYDNELDVTMLEDVNFLVENLPSGSIFLITFSTMHGDKEESQKKKFDYIKSKLQDRLPLTTNKKSIQGKKLNKVLRDIINNSILESLYKINSGKTDNMVYKQLFNFTYADGARMQTIGGIVYKESEEKNYKSCEFDRFNYVMLEDKVYNIEVPILTNKELRYLDSQLPSHNLETIDKKGIPSKDIKRYAEYYRYFPNYMEIEQ
jgi:hypothetical protein